MIAGASSELNGFIVATNRRAYPHKGSFRIFSPHGIAFFLMEVQSTRGGGFPSITANLLFVHYKSRMVMSQA